MTDRPTRFSDLDGVDSRLAELLERRGMVTAFPVQAAVVPAAAKGRDVLVQSPTGSGKTLAFGLPIIDRLERGTSTPGALILAPTRELAVQICDDLGPLATGKQLKVLAVYGGAPIQRQAKEAKTAAIVVATPGRLDDLIRNRKIDLRGVQIVVLDEADRMLDMGFQPQVDAIMEALPSGKKQTLLFSATLEGKVAKVAATYTKDAHVVSLDDRPGEGGEINHIVWQTTGGIKVDTVLEALEAKRDLAVVFVRTKRGADTLMERLRAHGVRATAIHGGMTQRERLSEYRSFQEGVCDVLVATDVFARGMDLDRITLVINYDVPEDADTYRHRTGRTGRAGRTGTAITMMSSSQRKLLRRMFREAEIGLDPFDDIRRTRRTGREPLPADKHFVPPRSRPSKPAGRPDRAGGRPHRDGAQRPRNAKGTTGYAFRGGNKHPVKKGRQPGDGSVASFDPAKGFGFITADGGGPDVFFHRKQVEDFDQRDLQRGVRVAFAAKQHDRGMRASEVRVLEADRS
jgi:superfamily II DNA/RNA helicase